MKDLITITFYIVRGTITSAYDSFESAVWNYLQKNKSKPLSPFEEKVHGYLFGDKQKIERGLVVELDEIQGFEASEFADYDRYDKAYPDRFVAKYDVDGNRIW